MVDKVGDARLIDWGLAGVVTNKNIPMEIRNRPLQFNTPFSSMVLNDEFKEDYDMFLEKVKDGTILFNRPNVRNYVINEYLMKHDQFYGSSDDNISIFNSIFSPSLTSEAGLS